MPLERAAGPAPWRIFHVHADQFTELSALPDAAPSDGFLWLGIRRTELEAQVDTVQSALQRWAGGQLVDLHVSDLLNPQLPSHFDYTSWYDLLVFRRLAPGSDAAARVREARSAAPGLPGDDASASAAAAVSAAATATATAPGGPIPPIQIDTSPVGFAVFDQVLLTVHPDDCHLRDFFAKRLQQQQPQQPQVIGSSSGSDSRNATRVPPNPADLALRMVNHMVDSYLELRRLLTRQLGRLEQELFEPRVRYNRWKLLLDARNDLHLLEDTCEDQRAAITEWIDALDELPAAADAAVMRERELVRVRSRDVLEHIERVLTHVRRLESSAENAVQMHFSAQSHHTNEIVRTLTVLTAIFMPLNLVTGFFGMNFEGLPLIHSAKGFWWAFGLMLVLGVGASWYFWRKRYLGRLR